MYVLITELILMGILTYVAYRYTFLVDAYNSLESRAVNYKAFADAADTRANNATADLESAYATIDRYQDRIQLLEAICAKEGIDFATDDTFISDFADDVAELLGAPAYDFDDDGNLIDPVDGMTYNPYASDVTDYNDPVEQSRSIALDRIKWTPDDLYTPDVNGSDEF